MLENKRQNIDHLSIATRLFEQVLLQRSEGFGKIDERRTIAKSARFALHDREIVPPIVNRLPRSVMRPADDAKMLAYDQTLRCNNDTVWINSNADGSVGKGCRNAVAIAIEVNQAGWGHPFAMLDKTIEDTRRWHQSFCFLGQEVSDSATHLSMRGLLPNLLASKLQPVVQGFQRWKAWCRLKEPMARILNILLDLAFLPTRRRIAELRLIEVVAGHCHKADVDVALLAASNLIDCRAHVVVDAAPRHPAEDTERVVMGIEQHLVRLQKIRPDDERPGIAKLCMGHLQFGALIADDCPVFRPVELEGLTRIKGQRNERPTSRCLQLPLQISFPFPSKSSNPTIRSLVAKAHQIGM
ncbi:hypothetical protein D3C86_1355820 [compost metagenome]